MTAYTNSKLKMRAISLHINHFKFKNKMYDLFRESLFEKPAYKYFRKISETEKRFHALI